MNRLTNPEQLEAARGRLVHLLDARSVWFLRESRDGRAIELRRGEWELRVASGSLVLSYWGEAGARTWRVVAWRAEGDAVFLEALRRMGAERALLWLVPRATIASARDAVAEARRRECERIAALVCRFSGGVAEQVRLSVGARRGEPGRWARVRMRRVRESIAVTGPVVPAGAEDAESFLSSALLWLARLEGGTHARREGAHARRPRGLWLIASPKLAAAVCERVALLREDLRALISVYELEEETDSLNQDELNQGGLTQDELNQGGLTQGGLTQVSVPALGELLDAHAPRLSRPTSNGPGELVEKVVALSPGEIDFVRARRGETLRFLGLPFARVRRLADSERLWFGVEGAQRRALLDDESAPDFMKLITQLCEHRRADASDRRHALYRAAPEAWLEAILRRDVTRLDPGLRLAPLHAQFRAPHTSGGARPVDLLALSRDGRLVVIELKVSEDVGLALQGADYWRRVEAQRRHGDIAHARLFGDTEIADDAPLVYVVAPLLRFHRSFATLARAIRPEIEMYRFDLNEDWRARVRVVRRTRIN
jgi:hypothetical protein